MKWCSLCKKICDEYCETDCEHFETCLPMLKDKDFENFLDENDINEDIVVLIISRDVNGKFYEHKEILTYETPCRVWENDWYEGQLHYFIGYTTIEELEMFHTLSLRKGCFCV